MYNNIINQQENPFFSIIVPVYKIKYDVLHRCINSILAQTIDNFEVILIDDGSPDECGTICEEYARMDSRVRVIHQSNGGLSVVRNVGFLESKGEWVSIVDGDDWIEPDTLEFAMEYVNEASEEADILIWDAYVDTNGSLKKNYFFETEKEGILHFCGKAKQELIDAFFPRYTKKSKSRVMDIGTTWARLYRRHFILDNELKNIPGLKRMQDTIFNLYAIEKARTVCYRCKHLYHYTPNELSATKRYDPDIVDTFYFLYEKFEEYVKEKNDNDYYQRLYVKFIILFGECFANYFAHPSNNKPLKQRRNEIAQAFSRSKFKEVLDRCDPSGQRAKVKVLRFLLKHKLYYTTILLSRINNHIKSYL